MCNAITHPAHGEVKIPVGVKSSAITAIRKKISARIKLVRIPKVLHWKDSRITR